MDARERSFKSNLAVTNSGTETTIVPSSPKQSPVICGRSTSTSSFSFRSIYSGWHWPTSINKAATTERLILAIGGLQLPTTLSPSLDSENKESTNSIPASLEEIEISPRTFIHTLKIQALKEDDSQEEPSNVVLCHGYGAGLGIFYKNFEALASIPNTNIYAIDWLGMGRSSRPKYPKFRPHPTWEAQEGVDFFTESLERWRVKQPSLESFTLVGHSLGGYLATYYALRYPHRVKKLILLSPVGIPEPPSEESNVSVVSGRLLPNWVVRLWNNNITPQWMVRSVGPWGPRLVKRYVDARFKFLPQIESTALSDYLYHISADKGSGEYSLAAILSPGAWARQPLFHQLKQLSMPTTFIYGDVDWMDAKHADLVLQHMQVPTKVLKVTNAGHHLYLDNYIEFNRILVEEIKPSK